MSIPSGSYDPETVALMGRVYDAATEDLKSAGIPLDEAVKAVMANRILKALSDGERDIDRLVQHAIEAVDASGFSAPSREPTRTRSA
jgi:predicted RNase H-like nuclease